MVTLGVEDVVSESVALRLVREYAPGLQWAQTMGLSGFGQLKKQMPTFNKIAQYRGSMLVVTDLDNPQLCPINLIAEWCQGLQLSPNLVFRIAVTEIEAWLIADRQHVSQWLAISESLIPRKPESVTQPKECLVGLARRSPNRKLREAIVPRSGSTRGTGPGYNERISSFASDVWNPEAARVIAPSLNRAIVRIAELSRNRSP